MITYTSCKICNSRSEVIFTERVLKKHNVCYFRCCQCGFIQTEDPFWLAEAYTSAITFLDIGLISRNISYSSKADILINLFFDVNQRFVDYGGGYGMFVRMMRDKGYNFYRQDLYCDNLFAKHFDINDLINGSDLNFELLTAFEVFEHLKDPLFEIKKMFLYSSNLLISTELQPVENFDIRDWWYIAPEIGQHISFYTEKSLSIIAKIFDTNYLKISNGLHLFTKKEINVKRLERIEYSKINKWLYHKFQHKKRNSLLGSDYNKLIGRKVF